MYKKLCRVAFSQWNLTQGIWSYNLLKSEIKLSQCPDPWKQNKKLYL